VIEVVASGALDAFGGVVVERGGMFASAEGRG
jgi:hypothetical protein